MSDYINNINANGDIRYISLSTNLYSYAITFSSTSSVLNITTPFTSVSLPSTSSTDIKTYFGNIYNAAIDSNSLAINSTTSSAVLFPCFGQIADNKATTLPFQIRCTSTSTYIDYLNIVNRTTSSSTEATIQLNKTVSSITLSAFLASSGMSIQYIENKIPSYYE